MGLPHVSAIAFDLDDLVDTGTAAEQVKVEPATIRKWKQKGLIEPKGLNASGRPLYLLVDVFRAEQKTRAHGSARRKANRVTAAGS